MAIHVVRSGESLWLISNLYNVPIPTIVQVNGLISANALVPGLALYIPEQELSVRYYQVKTGDSLWRLAQLFRINMSDIIMENQDVDLSTLYIGQRLNIPSPNKLNITSLGFIVPYDLETVLANLETFADQLSFLAIVAFSLTDEGYAYVEFSDNLIVARSKQLNIIPLLMVRNLKSGKFSPKLIGRVLENPNYRNNLVRSLGQLARQRGYGGVSIDFEFIPPQRRNDFILFLMDLKNELGDLILHVNVHATSKDLPTNPIVGGYDYREIGRVADIVAVMTIDYGYPGGPPDPVSPLWWMEQVIQYSISQINPRKLQIAMPLYGYDKTVYTNATQALSVVAAQNLAISTGSPIQFEEGAQSPWYRYWVGNVEHVVWFEDIRSFIEKYRLIDRYQLSGTTYWQMSLPAPQNWAYLSRNVTVVKE